MWRGRGECSAVGLREARGSSPAGVGAWRGRTHSAISPYQTTTPAFHNSLCRRQPGLAIAMKTDRSSGLSLVIRDIPWSFRPPIRHCYENRPLRQPLIRHSRHPFVNPAPHSSFRRRPESRGVGRGDCSAGSCPPLTAHRKVARVCATRRRAIFVLSCGLRKAIVIPADSLPRTPATLQESRPAVAGSCTASAEADTIYTIHTSQLGR